MEFPLMAENLRKEISKYTILLVDDEESMRKLIATFLSKLGHSCLTAIDGVDALHKMKRNKIDAVVTDIKMPNMDGITLASKISIQYPELPIMIMTAFEEEDTAGLAVCAGARDFIRKPFSLNEFSVRLHKMINDSEAQRRMKGEKEADKTGVDKAIEEFMNELESPMRTKRETDVDDGLREFVDALEKTLKES
jgi:DNA-binding NtrC family response regulator